MKLFWKDFAHRPSEFNVNYLYNDAYGITAYLPRRSSDADFSVDSDDVEFTSVAVAGGEPRTPL